MGRNDGVGSGPKTNVLHLVRVTPQPDADTVRLLEQLLAEARQGKLVGVVAIPFYGPEQGAREFDLSYAGTPARRPTVAVGAMDVCQMLMREIALEENGLS